MNAYSTDWRKEPIEKRYEKKTRTVSLVLAFLLSAANVTVWFNDYADINIPIILTIMVASWAFLQLLFHVVQDLRPSLFYTHVLGLLVLVFHMITLLFD